MQSYTNYSSLSSGFKKIIGGGILNFNVRLKKLRVDMNVSQVVVSRAIGISSRYYQQLEYGEKEPTLSKLIALADYFNVSLDYLTGRSNN